MKNLLRPSIISFIVICAIGHSLFAQAEMQDEKQRKNVVRVNLTNPLIFGDRSLVVGYERVVGKYKTFSLNLGQSELPEFGLFDPETDDPDYELVKNSKGTGFNSTADFRFYLQHENKYLAPHGIYVGPYVGYTTMGRKNTWALSTSTFTGDVVTDFNISFFTAGVELGYQFVVFKRFTIDLVLIGPGIAFYKLDAKLDTTLDPEDESELFQKINDALTERFPGYSFAIDGSDFEKTGSANVTSAGYRYVVQLGFMF